MLTRSLRSGSDSGGSSCDSLPYSKPYLLRSAADAISAAIDYSKADIEDGVVNSPPSRGPIRTPMCSPSPLRHVSSSRGDCFSPNASAGEGTNRKLNLTFTETLEPQQVKEMPKVAVVEPTMRATVITRSPYVRKESLSRTPIVAKPAHTEPPKPTSIPVMYRKKLNDTMSPLPPLGTRSLSEGKVGRAPDSNGRKKPKYGTSIYDSACYNGAAVGYSSYPSRRDDIMRGLAKLKADEAAKARKEALSKK